MSDNNTPPTRELNVGQPPVGQPLHGTLAPRGSSLAPRSALYEGRFGRMFRRLEPAPSYDDDTLRSLSESMREQAGSWGQTELDNPELPAGFTYIGQFIDHDVTFDPASSLQKRNDPDALIDFRSPRFDLDSVYGTGPSDDPFMYDRESQWTKFLIADNGHGEADLLRNHQGTALIGDPRNDENIIVSQLQLAVLQMHNRVVDEIAAGLGDPREIFAEAQRIVRWHYQWAVVHDYVRRIISEEMFARLWDDKKSPDAPEIRTRYYQPRVNAYMPIEFSAAAFRFGHTMIRPTYNLSQGVPDKPIFVPGTPADEFADLRGNRTLPQGWTVDWKHFLTSEQAAAQPSRRIDGRLADALFDLPHGGGSLAFRNLKRGQSLGLPSGQAVAEHLNVRVYSGQDLGVGIDPTPLWLYILREADIDETAKGARLGPVGSRIVGEVLLGMLEADQFSFYKLSRGWKPDLPAAGGTGTFTFADLIDYARGES